jgi:hypothetical protein
MAELDLMALFHLTVELKDPIAVLESVDSKEFAALLSTHNVMKAMADRNVTIFAPVDEAMKSHHVEFQESVSGVFQLLLII